MSEEKEESVMSATKKAIIGAITTAVTAGGAWFATHLGGGEEPKNEVKTEQTAPGAPVVINLQNNNTNQQKQSSGGTNTVIKERVIEKPAAPAPAPATKPAKDEEDPW
jgi:flagellar basal body-associated protein FliL